MYSNKPFLVLGLPRSRTAWLSVFLECHHEGMVGCESMAEYKDKIKATGDCSTTLVLIDIEKEFPDSKVIVIDNDIDKAVAFSKKNYMSDISEDLAVIKESLDEIDGLHIKFSEIDQNLSKIWTYVHDRPYNEARAERLKMLNIQITDPFAYQLNDELVSEIATWQL